MSLLRNCLALSTKKVLMLASISLLTVTYSYAQLPASNIYVGQLERHERGVKIKNLTEVTNGDVYANQPYFFDENTLYFTQEVKKGDSSQTDIFRFSIAQNMAVNITRSEQSEYSPTPTMDGTGFTVIRVNSDNLQHLWKFGFDGKPISHLVPEIEPIGYHAWTRDDRLLLFVLGEPQKLLFADPAQPDDEGLEIAASIGASIYEMPLTLGHTYTIENDQGKVKLFWFDANSMTNTSIGYLPDNAEYYAWSSSAELFTTDNGVLVTMPFIISGQDFIYTHYTSVEIDSEFCQGNVSRIALSPYNDNIALVCHD